MRRHPGAAAAIVGGVLAHIDAWSAYRLSMRKLDLRLF
jgi:hypothetical protein